MRRTAVLLGACLALGLLLIAPGGASAAFTQCPPVDKDTSCQFLSTVTDAETSCRTGRDAGTVRGRSRTRSSASRTTPPNRSPRSRSRRKRPCSASRTTASAAPASNPIPSGCVSSGNERQRKTAPHRGEKCPEPTLMHRCGFPEPAGEPAKSMFADRHLPRRVSAKRQCDQRLRGCRRPTSRTSPTSARSNSAAGVVNFSPAIPPGESTYFSLESPPVGGFGAAATLRRPCRPPEQSCRARPSPTRRR